MRNVKSAVRNAH